MFQRFLIALADRLGTYFGIDAHLQITTGTPTSDSSWSPHKYHIISLLITSHQRPLERWWAHLPLGRIPLCWYQGAGSSSTYVNNFFHPCPASLAVRSFSKIDWGILSSSVWVFCLLLGSIPFSSAVVLPLRVSLQRWKKWNKATSMKYTTRKQKNKRMNKYYNDSLKKQTLSPVIVQQSIFIAS